MVRKLGSALVLSFAVSSCIRNVPTSPPPVVANFAPLSIPVLEGPAKSTVFIGVRLFDGERTHAETTVIVRGNRIELVKKSAPIPPSALVIEGAGRTLLPGLIDAHAHPETVADLEQALVLGVTTELAMAGDPSLLQVNGKSGARLRADLFSAGTPLTVPNGHGTQFAEFPTLKKGDEVAEFVQSRVSEGSQFLKVIFDHYRPTVSPSVIRRAVVAANTHEMLTVAHIGSPTEANQAVWAGVGGLVHLWWNGRGNPKPEILESMVQRDVFLTPTLQVVHSICGSERGPALLRDADLAPFLSATAKARLTERFDFPPPPCGSFSRKVEVARSAGVRLLAGTDAGVPGVAHGASLHDELRLLVKAGLSPTEALHAATLAPALAFHIEDRGRVAKGQLADLVLVEGDPTREIRQTSKIVGVWKSGHRVAR